jgi:hypothetical protein
MENRTMKQLLMIAVVMCSVVAFGKDKVYDHNGRVVTRRIDLNKDAKYTATVGNTTVGCDMSDTSVYCAEQKPVTWDELWLDEGKFYFQWEGAGPGASMRFGTTGKDFVSMQDCNPLGKHVDAQFNYRYSKDHQAIYVPCTYQDKKGKAKTSEARYTLTPW